VASPVESPHNLLLLPSLSPNGRLRDQYSIWLKQQKTFRLPEKPSPRRIFVRPEWPTPQQIIRLPERPIPKADEIIAIDDDLVYPDIVVDDDLDDSDLVLDDNLDDSSLVSVEELAVELPFQTFTSSRTSNRTASLRSCGQQGVFKRLVCTENPIRDC
jgi:hypothetical protein